MPALHSCLRLSLRISCNVLRSATACSIATLVRFVRFRTPRLLLKADDTLRFIVRCDKAQETRAEQSVSGGAFSTVNKVDK
jgi:hypothetical protein